MFKKQSSLKGGGIFKYCPGNINIRFGLANKSKNNFVLTIKGGFKNGKTANGIF